MVETIRRNIRFTIMGLRLSGLYTDSDNFFDSKFYCLVSLFFNGFCMTLMNASMALFPLVYWNEINLAETSVYQTLTFIMPSVKIYFYLKNWRMVKNLIDRLDDAEFQPKNARQKELMDSFFFYQNSIHVLYGVFGTPMQILWLVIPVFSKDKKLPFLTWIPFDWKKPIVYELCYFHQIIGGICTSMVNTHMDMICFGFTSYISTEFQLLSDTIENMYDFTKEKLEAGKEVGADLNEEVERTVVLDEMDKTLLSCIRHHKRILLFVKDTEAFFSVLLFLQFGSSLFSLCLTMYELTVIPSVIELLAALSYQICIFAELLYYCFFGHAIITQSENVANALYSTPWMDCSPFFKRTLFFFLHRVQKPVQLRGINFFVLSLPTCASIYRISWSFFMLLQSTQNTH